MYIFTLDIFFFLNHTFNVTHIQYIVSSFIVIPFKSLVDKKDLKKKKKENIETLLSAGPRDVLVFSRFNVYSVRHANKVTMTD